MTGEVVGETMQDIAPLNRPDFDGDPGLPWVCSTGAALWDHPPSEGTRHYVTLDPHRHVDEDLFRAPPGCVRREHLGGSVDDGHGRNLVAPRRAAPQGSSYWEMKATHSEHGCRWAQSRVAVEWHSHRDPLGTMRGSSDGLLRQRFGRAHSGPNEWGTGGPAPFVTQSTGCEPRLRPVR